MLLLWNINIWYADGLNWPPWKGQLTLKEITTYRLRTMALIDECPLLRKKNLSADFSAIMMTLIKIKLYFAYLKSVWTVFSFYKWCTSLHCENSAKQLPSQTSFIYGNIQNLFFRPFKMHNTLLLCAAILLCGSTSEFSSHSTHLL